MDTINTGVTNDYLEFNYQRAGGVKLCAVVGCGTEIARFNTNGNVGIGYTNPLVTLAVNGIVNIGATNVNNGANSLYVDGVAQFNTTVIVNGQLQANGGCSGCDLAEQYKTSEDLVAGDVVAIDTTSGSKAVVKKAGLLDDALGIVSTAPGFTLGNADGIHIGGSTTTPSSIYSVGKLAPIALTGRVPVKFSNENGVIKSGDYLALSHTVAGTVAKAVDPGMIVGQALEDAPSAEDTVLVFVSHFYYDPTAVNLAALEHRVDDLDTKVTNLQFAISNLQNSTSTSSGLTLDATTTQSLIASVMSSIKADIVDGVTHFVQLAVDSLSTYALTVGRSATIGTADKPIGITVYDEDTGAPFCMKVKSGMQVSTPGVCGSSTISNSQFPISNGGNGGGGSVTPPPPTDPNASSTPPTDNGNASSTPPTDGGDTITPPPSDGGATTPPPDAPADTPPPPDNPTP